MQMYAITVVYIVYSGLNVLMFLFAGRFQISFTV